MKVFRIVLDKYSHEISGKGAAVFGGRWNSPGVEMVYTSEHRSLALCEILVHLTKKKKKEDYRILCIDIPDKYSIETLDVDKVAPDWNLYAGKAKAQEAGDDFIHNEKHLAIKVPSVIIPQEYNVLVNPYHPKFRYVKIEEKEILSIDKRYF